VDAQEVFQKCEFLFGSKKPKLRKELKYPGYVESPVHLVRYADLDQIRLKISYPGFAAGSAGEVFATVIEEMLAGGRNSSLSLALKENRSLVRGVHAYHDSHYHGGLFFIDCTFESLSSIEEIEKEVQKVLDLLCKGEFHEEAVELAKTKVMASWFFEQEKLEDLLYEIAPYMLCPDPGCYFEFSSRVSEVSVEDIRGAAETMFKKGAPVKSLFLPDECEEEISEKWRESDEL
jgi:predicted Zn-dependent peptidase